MDGLALLLLLTSAGFQSKVRTQLIVEPITTGSQAAEQRGVVKKNLLGDKAYDALVSGSAVILIHKSLYSSDSAKLFESIVSDIGNASKPKPLKLSELNSQQRARWSDLLSHRFGGAPSQLDKTTLVVYPVIFASIKSGDRERRAALTDVSPEQYAQGLNTGPAEIKEESNFSESFKIQTVNLGLSQSTLQQTLVSKAMARISEMRKEQLKKIRDQLSQKLASQLGFPSTVKDGSRLDSLDPQFAEFLRKTIPDQFQSAGFTSMEEARSSLDRLRVSNPRFSIMASYSWKDKNGILTSSSFDLSFLLYR